MLRLTGILLLLLSITVLADDESDIMSQKQELELLRSQVQDGQRRLDSLHNAQKRVQNEIATHDQRIASDRQVIQRLNRRLGDLRKAIAQDDSLLGTWQVQLDRRQRNYLGNIRRFYVAANPFAFAIAEHPEVELNRHREVIYLNALAGFETAEIDDASRMLAESSQRLADLGGKQSEITGLKRKRETSYALGRSQKQQQEQNLEQLRRKSLLETDRVMMLQQAEQEMSAIIARLEEARARTAEAGVVLPSQSAFAGLKGTLPSPYRGQITESFGLHVHPVTRLKSFAPGITIKGAKGRAVTAVAAGKVAYAGSLRGYGNFVIINHDHQYYTTYAGLGSIKVAENQYLSAGHTIGVAGDDGVIKFELRQGREPLDPVEWIRFEAL